MVFLYFFSDSIRIGDKAYIINEEILYASDSDEDQIETMKIGIPKMSKFSFNYEDSDYISSSEEEESREATPIQDDTNRKKLNQIFYQNHIITLFFFSYSLSFLK